LKTKILSISLLVLTLFANNISANSYDDLVSQWKSHDDVANWLDINFKFDKSRQKQIIKNLKKNGPSALLVRKPQNLFDYDNRGYCGDSANFAFTSLNKIDPSYNARWVFIKNNKGRPNHWVTAFDYQDKLYIMDYGTGKKWEEMKGIHGPYDSLSDYKDYLDSLSIPKFKAGKVFFRDMPGKED